MLNRILFIFLAVLVSGCQIELAPGPYSGPVSAPPSAPQEGVLPACEARLPGALIRAMRYDTANPSCRHQRAFCNAVNVALSRDHRARMALVNQSYRNQRTTVFQACDMAPNVTTQMSCEARENGPFDRDTRLFISRNCDPQLARRYFTRYRRQVRSGRPYTGRIYDVSRFQGRSDNGRDQARDRREENDNGRFHANMERRDDGRDQARDRREENDNGRFHANMERRDNGRDQARDRREENNNASFHAAPPPPAPTHGGRLGFNPNMRRPNPVQPAAQPNRGQANAGHPAGRPNMGHANVAQPAPHPAPYVPHNGREARRIKSMQRYTHPAGHPNNEPVNAARPAAQPGTGHGNAGHPAAQPNKAHGNAAHPAAQPNKGHGNAGHPGKGHAKNQHPAGHGDKKDAKGAHSADQRDK